MSLIAVVVLVGALLPSVVRQTPSRAVSSTEWVPAGPMVTARADTFTPRHTATLLDGPACRVPSPAAWCGEVLVAGGNLNFTPTKNAERYDRDAVGPAGALGRWASTAPMGVARGGHTATLLDGSLCRATSPPAGYPCGKVLVTGGSVASAELYDPEGGTWKPVAPMAVARLNHTATLLDGPACRAPSPPPHCGDVLVLGVATNDNQPQLYDPATDTWSPAALRIGVQGNSATLLDGPQCQSPTESPPGYCGKVLVIRSLFGTKPVSELYDPAGQDAAGNRGSWALTAAPAESRGAHAATLLPDGRVLVVGGAGTAAEVYDPGADGGAGAWARTGSMSIARNIRLDAPVIDGPHCQVPARATFCGQVVVSGGNEGIGTGTELYDPAHGTWSQGPAMGRSRQTHTLTSLPTGEVLAAGGTGRTQDHGYTELLDPAPPPAVTSLSPAVGLPSGGTKVVINGANLEEVSGVRFGDTPAVSYQVESPTRLVVVAPPHAQGVVDVTVLGFDGQVARGPALLFTFSTAAWTPTASMATARQRHSATLLGGPACAVSPAPAFCGDVLVVGGLPVDPGTGHTDDAGLNSSELYGATTAAWRPAAPLSTSRWDHTATLLHDGRVLVVAGRRGLGPSRLTPLASVELYEPDAAGGPGRWVAAPPLSEPRWEHAATLLADGRVLVTGGATCPSPCNTAAGGSGLASAEVFDPSADGGKGAWTTAGPMLQARSAPAVRLDDGRVLVPGGNAGGPSSEIYTPATAGGPSGWAPGPSMHIGRATHVAAKLGDGRVLVAGRAGTSLDSTKADVFDPAANDGAGSFSQTTPMAVGRYGTVVAAFGGGVVVAGGQGISGGPTRSSEFYDPRTNAWTLMRPMSGARLRHTATTLNDGRVLVAGGSLAYVGVASAEILTADALRPAPPAISAVSPAVGPAAGGTTVTIRGSGFFNRVESVNFGDREAEIVLLVSDELVVRTPPQPVGATSVVLAGASGEPLVTSEFTFAAGAWEFATPLEERVPECVPPEEGAACTRNRHTATLLDGPACRTVSPPDYCGQVLVVGGALRQPPEYWHRLHENTRISEELPKGALLAASAKLYEPDDDAWRPTGSLTVGRSDHTATLLDGPACRTGPPEQAPPWCGQVLVVGGQAYPLGPALASVEVYDPATGLWTPVGPMSVPRFNHAATVVDSDACPAVHCGKVVVTGGASGTLINAYEPTPSVEMFDPLTRTFLPGPSMSLSRAAHSLSMLPSGKLLVAGGVTHADRGARCIGMIGVPAIGHLLPDRPQPEAPDLPGPDPLCYAPLNTTEVWDLALPAAVWARSGDLDVARYGHVATVLAERPCAARCGAVLVAGGIPSVGVEAVSSELYDENATAVVDDNVKVKGAWSPAANLRTARGTHASLTLPDGRVLAAGSGNRVEFGRPSEAAEVYDPVTGSWDHADPMSASRELATATLLDGPACRAANPPGYCGKVLVTSQDTAELYGEVPHVTAIEPAVGPSAGNRPVVLAGSFFAGATSVRFGDSPPQACPSAACVIESATRIVATPPAHPVGAVQVVVTNAEGRSERLRPEAGSAFAYEPSGLPGVVTKLAATALSGTAVRLGFAATNLDGAFPDRSPPATEYIVKQSSAPIDSEAAFEAATSLCKRGVCPFVPRAVGDALSLDIGDLEPATTYHYSVRALGPEGPGPISESVAVTTLDLVGAASCPAVSPGDGQLAYANRSYRLVGLPAGTVVGAASPLYGWFDKGAGGSYSVQDRAAPVEAGRGYWAWFSCPTLVTLAQGEATSLSLPLGAYHASMVGNPSPTSPASLTGHDFAAAWDPGANDGAGAYRISGYRETQSLAVGEGTWAFSFVRTEIRIEAAG